MTKLTNKVTRQLKVNRFRESSRDDLQKGWEIARPEIAEYLQQVESKIFKGTNKNDTHHHEDNSTQNAMFRKDYTTVIGRLLPINPFLEDSFTKVGTDIAYSE